ncbi:MAG: anti-sigma factor family protein [bacterium]
MNCTQIQENIDLFLHNELEEPELGTFNRHTQSCTGCAEMLEQTRQLFAEIRNLPMAGCPDEIVGRIFQKTGIAEAKQNRWAAFFEATKASFFIRTPRLALSVVLLAAVLIVGSIYWTTEPEYPASKIEHDYSEAELRQQKALIEKALAPLFKAVRKSEILAKNEIIRANVIEPVQKSFLKAIKPSRN